MKIFGVSCSQIGKHLAFSPTKLVTNLLSSSPAGSLFSFELWSTWCLYVNICIDMELIWSEWVESQKLWDLIFVSSVVSAKNGLRSLKLVIVHHSIWIFDHNGNIIFPCFTILFEIGLMGTTMDKSQFI